MINKKVVSALMAAIAVSCLAGCTGRTESGKSVNRKKGCSQSGSASVQSGSGSADTGYGGGF